MEQAVVDLLRRGVICYATLPGGYGHDQRTRPVLIVSRDEVIASTASVLLMPITTDVSDRVSYPLVWRVPDGLLPRPSWVQIRHIRSAPLRALRDPLFTLDRGQMDEIIAGLRQLVE